MHHLARSGVKEVMTFSTGNHGLSVATAAGWFGIRATVVVPANNNPHKNRAILATGAELVEGGSTFEEAERTVEELRNVRDSYYVHPADEPHLINGVGTQFLDILRDLPDCDVVMVPLGAGSEAAAAVTVMKSERPGAAVMAVQAAESSAAHDSWAAGRRLEKSNRTFAGGFATGRTWELPFSIYGTGLEDFILLSESEIYDGMAMAMHHAHVLTEGAGSATIMAAYRIRDRLKGRKVVLQLSGSNATGEEIRCAANRDTLITGIPSEA